ncbi:hypothetical protein GCM10011414_26500 [Croceivirga lutea]|nr:hypothetical protein GCM10011414_26500 [Croceivirga lutea]
MFYALLFKLLKKSFYGFEANIAAGVFSVNLAVALPKTNTNVVFMRGSILFIFPTNNRKT